jgi:hypothetical protein
LKLTVQADAQKQELNATLEGLEELHREEAIALRHLQRDKLDEFTDRKLALWDKLRELSSACPLGVEHRAALERIRRAALMNQILLHHARDAVRTILQSASGQALSTTSIRPVAVQDGMRVDFRG